ncbi:unannotated protein [freshwater metagenome]|uniref:Unannotated protein n=1 Tax=freshwater metagenome TaxID=449393 RepID=A0A6J6QW42_9ZZZZ
MQRNFPTINHFRSFLHLPKISFNRRAKRLKKALTIWDLRSLAKRRTPRGPFDYVDGSAESEASLSRARDGFSSIEFHPSVLRDVSTAATATTSLGHSFDLPFGFAPTGFTRMMHSAGEVAVAQVAAQFNIPYVLSTLGTTSIEDVVSGAPKGTNWFQLYMLKDMARNLETIDRAKAVGVDTLVLTVDVPVSGLRLRDARNGLTIPPSLTFRSLVDFAKKPRWLADYLTTPPLEFAAMSSWNGTVAEMLDTLFNPSVTFEDLEWIRERWGGSLVIKGIQNAEDAVKCVERGANAIILSNHGGRQMDRAVPPLSQLQYVVEKVAGRAEVHLDTGITHGGDIAAALALGADFVWVGRSYLYGLMAGGQDGVTRAVEILTQELVRTMKLLGVTSIAELDTRHIKMLHSD